MYKANSHHSIKNRPRTTPVLSGERSGINRVSKSQRNHVDHYEQSDLLELERETESVLRRYGSSKFKKKSSWPKSRPVSAIEHSRSQVQSSCGQIKSSTLKLDKKCRNRGSHRLVPNSIREDWRTECVHAEKSEQKESSTRPSLISHPQIDEYESSDVEILENDDSFFEIQDEKNRLFFADGSSKNVKLRSVVAQALHITPFDSMSTLLAASSGLDQSNIVPESPSVFNSHQEKLIAMPMLKTKRSKSNKKKRKKDTKHVRESSSQELVLKDIPTSANESLSNNNGNIDHQENTCFYCWSKGTCTDCLKIEKEQACSEKGCEMKSSKNVLMCSKWDIDSLRRRYRSEQINDVERQSSMSLRFDKFQKKFCTIMEYKHPIYRLVAQKSIQCNRKMRRIWRANLWLKSFVDLVASGNVNGGVDCDRLFKSRFTVCQKRTHERIKKVKRISKGPRKLQFKAPTSTQINDIINKNSKAYIDVFVKEGNSSRTISTIYKNEPCHHKKYFCDQYFDEHSLLQPIAHFTELSLVQDSFKNCLESNEYSSFSETFVEWIINESIASVSTLSTDSSSLAVTNIRRCGKPRFDKVAISSARKDECTHNEGLTRTLHISSFVKTQSFPHFGNVRKFDRQIFKPAQFTRDIEYIIPREVLNKPEAFVYRPVDDVLHEIKPFPITIRSNEKREDKYFSPDKKLQELALKHGFRINVSTDPIHVPFQYETRPVIPSESISSPNQPSVMKRITIIRDANQVYYEAPFLNTSAMHFFHVLKSRRLCTSGEPQHFTCLGTQNQGRFLHGSDASQRIGTLTFTVKRNMVYDDEKIGDDLYVNDQGESFWYNRLAGQSYWEKLSSDDDNLLPNKKVLEKQTSWEDVNANDSNCTSFVSSQDSLEGEDANLSTSLDDDIPESVMLCSSGRNSSPIIQEEAKSQENRESSDVSRNNDELTDASIGDFVSELAKEIRKTLHGNENTVDMIQLGMGIGASLSAANMLPIHQNGKKGNPSRSNKSMQFSTEQTKSFVKCDSSSTSSASTDSSLSSDKNAAEKIKDIKPAKQNEKDIPNKSLPTKTFVVQESDVISTDESENDISRKCLRRRLTKRLASSNAHPCACDPISSRTTVSKLYKLTDFMEKIRRRRVGKLYVGYIEHHPNVPLCKPAGRLKPRSIFDDWNSIGFDPWSAGKDLLVTENISDIFESYEIGLEQTTGSLSRRSNKTGSEISKQFYSRSSIRVETQMQVDFDLICSYVRHGKYHELEMTINDKEWTLPMNYVDKTSGNSILMVCCQNGNKRMAKLCLRRGCHINLKNFNGQTCLHFAFGYGFDDLGRYLVSKGADESLTNAEGLTCYEGISMNDLIAL